jgi:hypothetical protein
MTLSLHDQILAAEDIPHEDVDVPEWGVKLQVRGLSGTERDAYEAKAVALKNAGKDVELRLRNFRSRFVVKCLFDPATGERVFTEGEADALGAKSAIVIDRLFDVARRMSGMDEDALSRAEGNSETDQSDSSISD